MPADPILADAAGNLAPAAPGLSGAVAAGDLAPSAPGVETPVFAVAGGGIEISGTISPALDGLLLEVTGPIDVLTLGYWSGSRVWSTDGAGTKSESGLWVMIYGEYFLTLEEATLDEIFPPENYTAGDWLTYGPTTFSFFGPVYYGTHYCYTDGGPAKWTDSGVATDLGATVIPAGTWVRGAHEDADVDFSGGLAATWQASPAAQWIWREKAFSNGSTFGYTPTWRSAAAAHSPLDVGTWSPLSGATGAFGVASGITAPALITPASPLPTTPAQIPGALIADQAPTAPELLSSAAAGNLSPAAPGGITP